MTRKQLAKDLDRIIREAAFRFPEVAERADTTVDQLNNWRFEKSQPTPYALEKLAEAFNAKGARLYTLAAELRTIAARLRGYDVPAELRAYLAGLTPEQLSKMNVEAVIAADEAMQDRMHEIVQDFSPKFQTVVSELFSEMHRMRKRLDEIERKD